MEPRELLDILIVAERLKDVTRHCYTSKGRHESVAEHSWMTCLMAFLMKEEFPEADMDKVIQMCLIHDLGEAFTGDIPVFNKTAADEDTEGRLLREWVNSLPSEKAAQMQALYQEMEARQTVEAKIYKALDKMEAISIEVFRVSKTCGKKHNQAKSQKHQNNDQKSRIHMRQTCRFHFHFLCHRQILPSGS